MKPKVTILDLYNTEPKLDGHGLILELSGVNTAGADQRVKVMLEWSYVPHIIRDLKKAWETERQSRMSEITSVDGAFPK